MRRSEIEGLIKGASEFFEMSGWTLPPNPKWDVTDFGLGDWRAHGLVLVNLCEEPEYCEKLMYARQGMSTPAHAHGVKKEDIICRTGKLKIQVWTTREAANSSESDQPNFPPVPLKMNGDWVEIPSGSVLVLKSGERVTLFPGIYHAFEPTSEECIIGEVSTANDDLNDNFFINPDIGRYPEVTEDVPRTVRLLSDVVI